MKKAKFIPLLVLAPLFLAGCAISSASTSADWLNSVSSPTGGNSMTAAGSSATGSTSTVPLVSVSSSPVSTSIDESEPLITLSDGNSTTNVASGVRIDNAKNQIVISALGSYQITGTLSEGSIVISAEEVDDENDTVELILNGASISSSGSNSFTYSDSGTYATIYPGPIFSYASAHLHVKALNNSTNIISDTRKSTLEVGDDGAAIFSNKLLRLKGAGSLNVTSTFNNGIASDSHLKAAKLSLSVSAPNNALKAHDSIVLGGKDDLGSFTIVSTGSDGAGVRVDEVDADVVTPVYGDGETEDDIAGIELKSAAYSITSVGKCVSSEGYLYVEGGNGTLTSSLDKGLKSELDLYLDGGSFVVKTPKDDSVHSSTANLYVNGGTFDLTAPTASSGQGLKAETEVRVNGGYIKINSSYEGIAAHKITMNGGTTLVNSSDDGWSAGGTNSQTSSNCAVTINGGFHYVYAGGDGIDSNGYFTVTGGTTVVSAPSSGGNGPLDSGDGYSVSVSGGSIYAYGTSGMTENLGGTQNSVALLSHTSVSSGSYYVILVNGEYQALLLKRAGTTFECSIPGYSNNAYGIYSSANVTLGDPIFEEAGLYKVQSYTSSGTLASGTFSQSASTHVSSGSSQGGGGGGGPGGGGRP